MRLSLLRKVSETQFNIDTKSLLHLPFNVFWKNNEGIYLGCNDATAEAIGFNSRKDIVGVTLYDFAERTCADSINQIDNYIMTTAVTNFGIEEATLVNNSFSTTYFSIKMPMYSEKNNLIGLFGVSINLRKLNLCDLLKLSEKLNRPLTKRSINSRLENFYINKIFDRVQLSKRQYDCSVYLIRGKTAKEIARALNISVRTVESYINDIKIKLNCYTKSQLLDKLEEILKI